MRIQVGSECSEIETFVAWLREQGHDATEGSATVDYVDGERDEHTRELMNSLWDQYCRS